MEKIPNFFNIGFIFDSEETKHLFYEETVIQRVFVNIPNAGRAEYIILKIPPVLDIEGAPHRKSIKQIWMFDAFQDVKPEACIQYTVLARSKFEALLRRANQLGPTVNINLPMLPETYDAIDNYSRERVRDMLSGGHNVTLYFDPEKSIYILPSQDVMTPPIKSVLNALEILSIAHRSSTFPLVDLYNWDQYIYDPAKQEYVAVPMPVNGASSQQERKIDYTSLFTCNPSGHPDSPSFQ